MLKPNPVLARRRAMRAIVQGIAGLALAVGSEGVLYKRVSGQTVDFLFAAGLFVVASILVYRAVSTSPPASSAEFCQVSRSGTRCKGPIVPGTGTRLLGTVSIGANVGALVLFASADNVGLAWLLYLASIVGVLLTLYLSSPYPRRFYWLDQPRYEAIALLMVLVIAAFFRFYLIGTLPVGLWSGEAQQGLLGERILVDPSFRPVWLSGIDAGPALTLYLQAALVSFLGPTKLALRLLPAMAGVIGVLAAYLLGRELFGWRTGLVAGALLAVSCWHVDFSRMNVGGIWLVTFDALAAYFLVRALNRNRSLDFGLAGLCLGLGVQSSWSSLLFGVVLVLYVVHRWTFARRELSRGALVGLVAFVAVFAITLSPVAEFVEMHPATLQTELSHLPLRTELQQTRSMTPLARGALSYITMFNYRGDPNGRNNLNSWPQLDLITGGIFLAGLVACLRLWKRPGYFFPILSLVIMSLGGVLTGGDGAPDSANVIDNSLTCVLIAAVPIGFIWSKMCDVKLGRIAVPFRSGVPYVSTGAVVVLVLLAGIAATNFHRYFIIQANDGATYAAFSTGPTLAAEAIRRLGSEYDVYVSSRLVDQPSIKFLSQRAKPETPFDPATTLPLRGGRNAAFFFTAEDVTYFDAVRRFYPGAALEVDRQSPEGPIVLYTAVVPSPRIDQLHGLDATFANSLSSTAPPELSRVDGTIDFDWSTHPPLPIPFVGSWRGIVTVPSFGTYGLRLEAPAGASLKIDERDVLHGTSSTSISLAQGRHAFELIAPFEDPGTLRLWWTAPGQPEQIVPSADFFHEPADNRGLLGIFFPNATWSGPPTLERIDVSPTQSDFPPALSRPFSVNWTGKIDIPRSGLYRFGTRSVDFSWLYLDGKLVVDNSHGANQLVDEAVNLTQGLHDIRLSYLSRSTDSFVTIYWQPPGFPREQLPPDRLFPPQGAYPERAGPLTPPAVAPAVASPSITPTAPVTSPIDASGPLPSSPLPIKLTFGSHGNGPGQLSDPRGIAVDADGNSFVVDTGNLRVEEFSADGKPVRTIGQGGSGDGQFQEPVAAVMSASGDLAVLDSASGWISRFSPNGAFLGKFGGPSAGFYHPRGLSIDSAGNYYVANTGSSQVDVFNPSGVLFRELSDTRKIAGRQALQPVGVAVAPDGSLYVADAGNFLLFRYNLAFVEQQVWKLPSSDSVHGPHVTLNRAGDLYLTDPANHRVIHLDPDGKPRDQLGSDSQLSRPVGVTTDAAGNVYVVDSDADKVIVYGR